MPLLKLPSRRFGRTGIDMPVLSLGGMRFQKSWKDLPVNEIGRNQLRNLEKLLDSSLKFGFYHLETARHYGTSETELGIAMKRISNKKMILQTKIPPNKDPSKFEDELNTSFQKLGCKKLDLLAIHGLNLPEHLEQVIGPSGCLKVVRRWQKKGLIGHVGFSTHGSVDLIVKAIETNEFDYVNLHWYFIAQDNEAALEAAKKHDLGVFIISPTDKGGHLHSPSKILLELCSPLHPIVFNDLFCLSDPRVHTISVGASNPKDLQLHLDAVNLIGKADELVSIIHDRLINAACIALGDKWLSTWQIGLPSWQETPGHINVPVLLWLYNLIEAWGMEDYARARYQLLGNGGHWFPGENADELGSTVAEQDLKYVLVKSPWCDEIPFLLMSLRDRLGGGSLKRLSDI